MSQPIVYSQKTARNGRIMYFAGNKLVSKDVIPETAVILDRDFILEQTVDEPTPPTASVEPEPTEPVDDTCVSCGGPSDSVRWLNMKPVNLCQLHYDTLTLGEVAQAVREHNERREQQQ